VLRIFIALKNLSRWSGSNPQILGPVASTLTTKPPRRLSGSIDPLLLASEPDGGERLVSRPGCFTPRERIPVPIRQEAGWAPEPE
jgi:hypothetical protein